MATRIAITTTKSRFIASMKKTELDGSVFLLGVFFFSLLADST